jgi:crotonobetainyl-CoA:carnitine CoA-transferase CaiB-like acyl-CoA transferase
VLRVPYLLSSFRSQTGWCVLQVSRRHQFERLARLLGRPGWLDDDRFAGGFGWFDNWESTIRPALESWAASRTMLDTARDLAEAGITAAPCHSAGDVVADPHVASRGMLVEIPRSDGVERPVLVPGNPVKMSDVADAPETRPPLLGEHTAALLAAELGLDADHIAELAAAGVIASDVAVAAVLVD